MKRFLLLISRHPVLARDEVVKFFLSASGHVSHQQIPLNCYLDSTTLLLMSFFYSGVALVTGYITLGGGVACTLVLVTSDALGTISFG